MKNLDLTKELAKLLDYTANVATAIRLYSAYNQNGNFDKEAAPYDLMFLSDSLHNFSSLSDAIASKNNENIIYACDLLISNYHNYGDDKFKPCGKITFQKHEALGINLESTITIFEDIKRKVSPHQNPH